MQDLSTFFSNKHFIESKAQGTYNPMQLGAKLSFATQDNFEIGDADIVIIGCGERRGEDRSAKHSDAPDTIREELYKMYAWHGEVSICDAGNIVEGATVDDTRAALRTVLMELRDAGKTVLVIGGSHDLTLQQYEAFSQTGRLATATVADMLIDLEETEGVTSKGFLMDMLTEEPNFISHYSHIGFQSYYVQPKMLETLDKLRFDFFRLGMAREQIEEMEPVLRSSDLFSFDISAVKYCDAPVNKEGSPNGFAGDEACLLTRYAGMSDKLTSFGIYGYDSYKDEYEMTARLISQMVWYFVDGYLVRKTEAPLTDEQEYISYHVSFTGHDTVFKKSKRSNRWWMKLPNEKYIACSYNDYLMASNGDMPERWLREQERLV